MKISLNIIKQYTSLDLSVDDLVSKLNQQLGKVETVVDLGKRYVGATIVKIVDCQDHPDADRLHICKIDDGQVTPDVARDENGLVTVVCGAPNVREGLFVVWLPSGSTVPASFDEQEPFVLGSRPLRGVVSHGMLGSPKELGIGDSHDGILEIDPAEWSPKQADIKPGASFAEVFGLDDTIIDIENKMFTHRPDCFGQLGIAREIAGIQQQQFVSPQWYMGEPDFKAGDGLALKVRNEAEVPRFMAVAVKDVTVKPSPLWLQIELSRLGSRPINNIVDVTNYVMVLTGQPLHAYDYDKVSTGILGVRYAQNEEQVALLNGKSLTLNEKDIVITDGSRPIGLAGVMGGSETEVSAETRNIILEVATFDMYTIRRTSMRHGLFTDAVTRFTKGQSPLQNPHVLNLALQSIQDVAGGALGSAVQDSLVTQTATNTSVSADFINQRLGLELTADQVQKLLGNVEISSQQNGNQITVQPPFWRTDIEQPEDIVEEVGRLYGFDKLPKVLPRRAINPAATNQLFAFKNRLRQVMASNGAHELLTYSFTNAKVLENAQQKPTDAFKLSNALSPDLQYYRLTVLPSLLEKVRPNIKASYNAFTLYEIGKGHNLLHQNDDPEGLPVELEFVDLVYASKQSHKGAPFYGMRAQLDVLAASLGLTFAYAAADPSMDWPVTAPFDLNRSAMVTDEASGGFIGLIGELKASVRKGFKLPDHVAAATLDLAGLQTVAAAAGTNYQPLSKYPATSQDLCLRVSATISYKQVYELVQASLQDQQADTMISKLSPLDIYQKDSDAKQITLRYTVSSNDKTMTDTEVAAMLDIAATKAHEELQAVKI